MNTEMLTALLAETLRSPRSAAQRLMEARIEPSVLWLALVLVTVLNALSFYVSNVLFPPPEAMPVSGLSDNPMLYAFLSGGALVISVFVLTWVGRRLGGTGQVPDMLVLMIWLQFIGLVLQVATLVVMLTLPPLAVLLYMITLGLSLWLTLNFVSAAHGFVSNWRALWVIFLSVLGISFGVSILLMLMGVSLEGMQGNV